jgi:hypothetical protein
MDWPRRADKMPYNNYPSEFIRPVKKIPSGKAFSAFLEICPVNGMVRATWKLKSEQNTTYHGGHHLTKAAISTHPWLQGVKNSNQGNGGQE